MDKRKLLRVGLPVILAVVLLGACGFFGYRYYQHHHGKKNSTNSASQTKGAPVQTKQQVSALVDSVAEYNAINKAFISKDNAKTIKLAITYGKDPKNNDTDKLNIYGDCILAAADAADTGNKKTCYDDAVAIANKLTDAKAKADWLSTLSDANNGTAKPEVDNAPVQ